MSKFRANSCLSAPKDLTSQTTCNDEGPNKLSPYHKSISTNPYVLVEKTKSVSKGLKIVLTQPTTEKGVYDIAKKMEEEFNTPPDLFSSEDTQKEIKLGDLSRLVQDVRVNFIDLDSQVDDPKIIIDESEWEEEDEEIHATKHTKTKDTLAPQTPSPREHIKKDKGKKDMSSKDVEEEGGKSDSDDTTHLTGSMVESLKKKKLKKFNFITEEVRKEELVDLLGLDVVSNYYKAKLPYDKNYDKMLNRRESSTIINCNVLTRKGHITQKVYREDRTSEVILNFKASDLHLTRMDYLYETEAGLGIDLDKPLSEQDPLEKLNGLAKKKRKNVDYIHDNFKENKRLKSSI
nr:hypothetical protein [Tanacetum cinerariifolium]